jgi:ABC-type multidrug transport system fused ATPase/permease subunit
MIYHPVLGYFARDYSLQQVAVEHEGKEPSRSPQVSWLTMPGVWGSKTIFVQKEFDRKNSEVIATEIGAAVVKSIRSRPTGPPLNQRHCFSPGCKRICRNTAVIPMGYILEIESLTAGYGDKIVLRDVTLKVDATTTSGLLDPTGWAKQRCSR